MSTSGQNESESPESALRCEEESPRFKVQLAVYDLSQGMARQLGPALLGMEIEAIYHTGLVVYGKEHFFGGGIVSVPHEEFLASYHMQPFQTMELGETEVGEDLFMEFLQEVSPRFTAETYDLMRWNCNNFTNEAALFLLGTGIPPHILTLPERVFSSPMGALLRPAIEQMQGGMRQAVPGFHFESFEGGGEHHHVNVPPPLVPPHTSAPPPSPLPAVHHPNPWAVPAPQPASVGVNTTGNTSTSTGTQRAEQPRQQEQRGAAPTPVLDGQSKPLLSVDSPAALRQSLRTVVAKLKLLASAPQDGEGEHGASLLSPEEAALLDETEGLVLQPLSPLPPALAPLLHRCLLPPWSGRSDFFVLSLLRPLFLRPTFPTAPLLDLLLTKLALTIGSSSPPPSPLSAFASRASLVVAFSALSNACAHKAGRSLLLEPERAGQAVDVTVAALRDEQPAVRQMAAAFLANLALGVEKAEVWEGGGNREGGELSDLVVQMVCGSMEGLGEDGDQTSVLRRLLCAGRLVRGGKGEVAALVRSLGLDEVLREVGRSGGAQVLELARELLSLVEGGGEMR